MKYAIVECGGKQYKVEEGQEILVDRLKQSEGEHIFDEVLLLRTDNAVSIGTPYVENAKIRTSILGTEKGEKIRVSKFKAKVRYRRSIGFRPQYTRLRIDAIDSANLPKNVASKETVKKSPTEKTTKKLKVAKTPKKPATRTK